jgi:hypothetical protein
VGIKEKGLMAVSLELETWIIGKAGTKRRYGKG